MYLYITTNIKNIKLKKKLHTPPLEIGKNN